MPLRFSSSDVTKKYGATTALDRISFAVEAGEMFGLIGPDGAGKTTAIRSACGLIGLDGGRIEVLGKDPTREHRADHRGRSATCRSASVSTAI